MPSWFWALIMENKILRQLWDTISPLSVWETSESWTIDFCKKRPQVNIADYDKNLEAIQMSFSKDLHKLWPIYSM